MALTWSFLRIACFEPPDSECVSWLAGEKLCGGFTLLASSARSFPAFGIISVKVVRKRLSENGGKTSWFYARQSGSHADRHGMRFVDFTAGGAETHCQA